VKRQRPLLAQAARQSGGPNRRTRRSRAADLARRLSAGRAQLGDMRYRADEAGRLIVLELDEEGATRRYALSPDDAMLFAGRAVEACQKLARGEPIVSISPGAASPVEIINVQ
jgi:hypothetical protein